MLTFSCLLCNEFLVSHVFSLSWPVQKIGKNFLDETLVRVQKAASEHKQEMRKLQGSR